MWQSNFLISETIQIVIGIAILLSAFLHKSWGASATKDSGDKLEFPLQGEAIINLGFRLFNCRGLCILKGRVKFSAFDEMQSRLAVFRLPMNDGHREIAWCWI
jgi:hypothetical protein